MNRICGGEGEAADCGGGNDSDMRAGAHSNMRGWASRMASCVGFSKVLVRA